MSEPVLVRKITPDEITSKLESPLNIEHLKTMYDGDLSHVYAELNIVDPRKVRPKQRALFFSLLNEIQSWSGAPMKEFLKDYFYTAYSIETEGKEISLAADTTNSVSDANKLLDLVVEFIFQYNVPINDSYELLPRDENYFLYQCCKHRKCVICGKHADIDHIDEIGSGLNRTHVDHSKRHVIALCRVHHIERHQIGNKQFSNKYHTPLNGIKLDVETLKKIGVKGDYKKGENNGNN